MAYRIDVTPLDVAQVFGGAIPTVTGTLTSVLPGGSKLPPDPAVAIPGASTTSVLFPAATSGMFPASVVLSDTGAGAGQLFRSGVVTLPASPGQVTLYTAVGALLAAELSAFGASLGSTQFATRIADGWRALGYLFGFLPPDSITITSASITPGAGSLAISLTGSGTYRFFLFIPFTQTFTISTTVTITPSGDGERTDRVVSVVPTGTTLTLPTADPILRRIGATTPPVPFNLINGTLTDALEPIINRAIINKVDGVVGARVPPVRRTPTSVVSARTLGISPGGISAQIMLADFGPALAALPRTLALSVSPAPVPNVQKTYTFRVVDRATRSPIAGATVTLTNHSPTTTQTRLTDAQGDASFTARLRTESLGGGALDQHLDGDPRLLQPYAAATAPGAQATTLILTLVEPV
jgi:hypothetical protein